MVGHMASPTVDYLFNQPAGWNDFKRIRVGTHSPRKVSQTLVACFSTWVSLDFWTNLNEVKMPLSLLSLPKDWRIWVTCWSMIVPQSLKCLTKYIKGFDVWCSPSVFGLSDGKPQIIFMVPCRPDPSSNLAEHLGLPEKHMLLIFTL